MLVAVVDADAAVVGLESPRAALEAQRYRLMHRLGRLLAPVSPVAGRLLVHRLVLAGAVPERHDVGVVVARELDGVDVLGLPTEPHQPTTTFLVHSGNLQPRKPAARSRFKAAQFRRRAMRTLE